MKKKILSGVLALSLVSSLAMPAFATSAELNKPSSIPVELYVNAATFSVTVPSVLPIDVDANGTVYTADNAKVTNNSAGLVEVKSVDIRMANKWALSTYNSDFKAKDVNAKELGLLFNNVDAIEGDLHETFTAFPANTSQALKYDAKLPPQSSSTTKEQIAFVVFTIGWKSDNGELPPIENPVGTVADDNTITLSGVEAGTYTLSYANANGPLANFEEICELTVTDPTVPVSYNGLIPENCAPLNATMIGVYNESGEKVGEIGLGGLAVNMGTKQYSFGAISDVHLGYNTSESDFKNALTYFSNEENVSFVGISGDLTAEATDEQYQLYKDIVEQYATIPVYEITGNHDTEAYRGSNVSSFISEYIGNPIYYSFEHGGDLFIMLGIEQEKRGAMLPEGSMQWLYETLESNRDKRCFIFVHPYTNNSSGDPSDLYGFDMWAYDEEEMFMSLLDHYSNVTLFHGHSHIEFAIQNIAPETNIDTAHGYNSIHIPSISVPRTGEIGSGESAMFNYLTEESEGYVVDVYQNGIILRGRDFVGEKFLPIAHYKISTPVKSAEAGTYVDSTGNIDVTTMYDLTVTQTLTNAHSTYPYAKVMSGSEFNTTIVGDWGYAIDGIKVTMGGTDITNSAVTDNQINIANVTGDIVITVATHYVSDNIIDVVGYSNDTRFSGSSGAEKEEAGHVGSGYIYVGDFVEGDVINISGVDFRELEYPDCGVYVGYDKDKNVITGGYFNESQIRQFSYTIHEDGSVTLVCDDLSNRPITYLRVSGMGLGENLVITKN